MAEASIPNLFDRCKTCRFWCPQDVGAGIVAEMGIFGICGKKGEPTRATDGTQCDRYERQH